MNRLKVCRENCNLSQKQVAIELNVSAPTVSQWESGVASPSTMNLIKLSDLYGVSLDYLIGRIDKKIDEKSSLSFDETNLISDYRLLNEQGKEYIRQTMFMAKSIYKTNFDISNLETKR